MFGNRYNYGVYGYTVNHAVWFNNPRPMPQCDLRYVPNYYPYRSPCFVGERLAILGKL